jgi:transcriptional regulator with XRE-family HTH domain
VTQWRELLRELQAERGISTRQLAVTSGVDRSSIIRFSRGRATMRIDLFERLVAALGYELGLLDPHSRRPL